MLMLPAILALMVQDGLSYRGPSLDQLSADAYAIYFDRTMSGPIIALEGDGPDGELQSIKTDKCVSHITGRGQSGDSEFKGVARSWVIDWKTVKSVGQDVPYFFAVLDKNDRLLAFLTGGEAARTPLNQADMLSITTAYGAAVQLHIACNPAAKAYYQMREAPPQPTK